MYDLVCDVVFNTIVFTVKNVRRFWLKLERS